MAPPFELTASGAAVLSLLTFGEASGYELRTRADATLRFFFAAPAMSQIYAELDRLAAGGLVASRDAQRPGSRPGRVWRLTPKGRRRLAQWAAEEPVPPTVSRDHLALRLMLGALVAPERLQAMVDEQRDRVAADRADLQAVADTLDADAPDTAHPALVAEWGLTTFDTELAALARIRDRLAELPRRPTDEAAPG
jgi:DNA-binding PadR family transcriptional regulator